MISIILLERVESESSSDAVVLRYQVLGIGLQLHGYDNIMEVSCIMVLVWSEFG